VEGYTPRRERDRARVLMKSARLLFGARVFPFAPAAKLTHAIGPVASPAACLHHARFASGFEFRSFTAAAVPAGELCGRGKKCEESKRVGKYDPAEFCGPSLLQTSFNLFAVLFRDMFAKRIRPEKNVLAYASFTTHTGALPARSLCVNFAAGAKRNTSTEKK